MFLKNTSKSNYYFIFIGSFMHSTMEITDEFNNRSLPSTYLQCFIRQLDNWKENKQFNKGNSKYFYGFSIIPACKISSWKKIEDESFSVLPDVSIEWNWSKKWHFKTERHKTNHLWFRFILTIFLIFRNKVTRNSNRISENFYMPTNWTRFQRIREESHKSRW